MISEFSAKKPTIAKNTAVIVVVLRRTARDSLYLFLP